MAQMTVDWRTITDFVTEVFTRYGVPPEDAAICADNLLEADRRGIESHGVNRFKSIYLDRIKAGVQNPVTRFEIIKDTPTTAVVDGHDGMGQVVGYKCMKLAIEKAKAYGMGMVVARNSCHYGIAGYYTAMATKAGCVGMTGTNARPSVAPTWGVEGMFGTNPLTLGVPTDEPFDFNFDCATSITQNGKVEYYARIGEDVKPGTVIGDGHIKCALARIDSRLLHGQESQLRQQRSSLQRQIPPQLRPRQLRHPRKLRLRQRQTPPLQLLPAPLLSAPLTLLLPLLCAVLLSQPLPRLRDAPEGPQAALPAHLF